MCYDIQLNKHSVNVAIKFHELSDVEMKEAGFRLVDNAKTPYWSYSRFVGPDKDLYGVSFWVHFPVGSTDPDDLQIDVIDNDFGQPYDFQRILRINPQAEYAGIVRDRVEEHMAKLQAASVLSGHVRGEYI